MSCTCNLKRWCRIFDSSKTHIRTFPGVSAWLCSVGLASHATIPATELFGSSRRSVLCSLFSRRASSWCALGLLGRRVCIFLSPAPFCHPREHAKLQGSCVVMPTKGFPKNSFIGLEGVSLFVRACVWSPSLDARARASSSRSGLYSRL